jgi:hypothetical protein
MNITKTLIAAVAMSAFASASIAGGLSPQIMETPEAADDAMAAAPSINATYVVVGVLAALLLAAAMKEKDGSSTTGSGGGDLPPGCTDNCDQ